MLVVGLCEGILCLLRAGLLAFVYHLSVFRYFFLYFPSFPLPIDCQGRFFFHSSFGDARGLLHMYVSKIHVHILRNIVV